MPSRISDTDLSHLVTGWLARYDSHHTKMRYRRDLGLFAAFLHPHGKHLLDATPADVNAWTRHLSGRDTDFTGTGHAARTPNTIAVKVSAVSSFYRYCQQRDYLPCNPVERARDEHGAGTWVDRDHSETTPITPDELRAVLCAAHRDPYLGGPLGVALLGLMVALRWRPEAVVHLTVRNAVNRLDPDPEGIPRRLPAAVDEYLEEWLAERPVTSKPGLFRDNTGQRRITTVDVLRLVHRSAIRAGLDDLTAARVVHTAELIHTQRRTFTYPTMDELRRDHPAPHQLAIPDTPDAYSQHEDAGQAALIPLPESVETSSRTRRRKRERERFARRMRQHHRTSGVGAR